MGIDELWFWGEEWSQRESEPRNGKGMVTLSDWSWLANAPGESGVMIFEATPPSGTMRMFSSARPGLRGVTLVV
jgi:hypothetical protein